MINEQLLEALRKDNPAAAMAFVWADMGIDPQIQEVLDAVAELQTQQTAAEATARRITG